MPRMPSDGPLGPTGSEREPSPYVELDRATWASLASEDDDPLSAEEVERLRGLRRRPRPRRGPPGLPAALAAAEPARASRPTAAPQAGGVPPAAAAAAHAVRDRARRLRRRRQVDDRPRCCSRCWPTGPRTPTSSWSPPTASSTPTPSSNAAASCTARASRSPTTAGRCCGSSSTSSPAATRSTAPIYSHLVYDVVPDERVVVKSPDIVIIEGLNVLQPARVREDGRTGLTLSDFFDFSVYVDAATSDIRQWYVERFLRLRETAFRDPASYFTRYAALSPERGRRRGRADLGHHQRPEPRPEHPAHPRPRRPGAAQGPRPLGPLRAAAQALTSNAGRRTSPVTRRRKLSAVSSRVS